MSKSLLRIAFGLSLGLLSIAAATAQTAPSPTTPPAATVNATPALWKVKGVKGTVYLFGTVHVMRKDVHWETPQIAAAMKASDVLYLEVPGVDEAAQKAATPMVMQLGLDQEHPLSTKISKDDVAQLDTVLKKMGAPGEQAVEPMQPWLVYLTLSVLPAMQAGYDPNSGIDRAVQARMTEAGKPVKGFETVEQQIHLLADFPQAQQVELLHQELAEMPNAVPEMNEITAAWEKGDVEKIWQVDNGEMKAKHPELYEKILVSRNLHFAEAITAMLKDPATGTVFVAIGAAHFAGSDSVIKSLEKQGFAVTRVE